MDPSQIFKIITNSTLLATRLLPSSSPGPLSFTEVRYCSIVPENAPLSAGVANVTATHAEDLPVQYSITGGNRDGLFTIDRKTGFISLAAHLDYELNERHLLEVSAESGRYKVRTSLHVLVADVNDTPPRFQTFKSKLTIIEEDDRNLPRILIKASASDPDLVDENSLVYSIEGEGTNMDTPGGPIFSINPDTGEVYLLRAVDRDPPFGRSIYKIKVIVRDGNINRMAKMKRDGKERLTAVARIRRKVRQTERITNEKEEAKRQRHNARETAKQRPEARKTARQKIKEKETVQIANLGDKNNNEISRRLEHKRQKFKTKIWVNKSADVSDGLSDATISIQTEMKAQVDRNIVFDDFDSSRAFQTRLSSFDIDDGQNREGSVPPISQQPNNRLGGTQPFWWLSKINFTRPHDATKCANIDGMKCDSKTSRKRMKSVNVKTKKRKINEDRKMENEGNNIEKTTRSNLKFQPEKSHLQNYFLKLPEEIQSRKKSNSNLGKTTFTFAKRQGNSHSKFRTKKLGKSQKCHRKIGNKLEKKLTNSSNLLGLKKLAFRNRKGNDRKHISEESISKLFQYFSNSEKVSNYEVIPINATDNCLPADYQEKPKVYFCLEKKLHRWLRKNNLSYLENIFCCRNYNKFPGKNSSFETFLEEFFFNLFALSKELEQSEKNYTNVSDPRIAGIKCALLHSNGDNTTYISNPNHNSFSSRSISDTRGNFITLEETNSPQNIKSEPFLAMGHQLPTDRNESIGFIPSFTRTEFIPSFNETGPILTNHQYLPIPLNKKNNLNHNKTSNNNDNSNNNNNNKKDWGISSEIHPSTFEEKEKIQINKEGSEDTDQKDFFSDNALFRVEEMGKLIYHRQKFQPMNFTESFAKVFQVQKCLKDYYDHLTSSYSDNFRSGNDVKLQDSFSGTSVSGTVSMKRKRKEEEGVNRVRREVIKGDNELLKEEDTKVYNQMREFCILTDPRIKMSKHEGSFASQYEQFTTDKDLTPFLSRIFMESSDQHETSVVVTIIVKDINDNAPVFPNATMYGEVQENGPIDLSVVTVTAWDADDATSGTNARLTYSLEKNVVDEKTGEPLFSIHPRTGELRTALCCLDRETTPEYRVQVVASDGGGLKGSGTVVVLLADVNDNSPRLTREEWNFVIDETSGSEDASNDTLFEISVADPDISNYFYYRVVNSSGKGWDYFGIRTLGSIGELYAKKTLDYENKDHKDGFQFDVQVTDRGPGGWNDTRHVDMGHVNIQLRDVNDNDPIFETKELHVTVQEDVPIDTVLAKLPAQDLDENLNGQLDYKLLDDWGNLRVDETGGIRVWQPLDREGVGGDLGIVRVTAVDRGTPMRSATATLTISLMDVNDCPPQLQPPHVFHVLENTPAQEIGTLKAMDDDIWSEGNGPPFEFSLAMSNPEDTLEKISLTFDSSLDNGRGGAKLWTRKPLDREEHRSITVNIALSDSRGLVSSQPIFIDIIDVNDNQMKPGNKTVYIWKTEEAGLDASLGRIYVEDPDDWDIKDKSFEWIGAPHPLFTLDKDTGTIYASGLIREGRYELEFGVSDLKWNQHRVRGNVTVIVRHLSQDALTHAVPLTLSLTSPNDLTRDWNPMWGGGPLGALLDAAKENIDARQGSAVVVSVYGTADEPQRLQFNKIVSETVDQVQKTHVWISYQEEDLSFMNPIKLRGILEMNILKIRKATNLLVNLEAQGRGGGTPSSSLDSTSSTSFTTINYPVAGPAYPLHPPQFLPKWSNGSVAKQFSNPTAGFASATSLASTAHPLQVVDNNYTSYVTPRLLQSSTCLSFNSNFAKKSDECLPDSCLNGGKCVSSEQGKRCVCPGGTLEPFCKISSRGFERGGWAWIKPVPSCAPTSMSLSFLTAKPEGMILYSGPLTPSSSSSGDRMTPSDVPNKRQKYPNKFTDFDSSSNFNLESGGDPHFPSREGVGASSGRKVSPLFALYLSEGRVHLSVEGTGESVHLVVNSTESLNDGKWHSVRVLLDEKKISMSVDFCISESSNVSANEGRASNCIAMHNYSLGKNPVEFWGTSGPLQIGGLAQRTPKMADHGWNSQPVGSSLEGCIGDLRIGELIDLGGAAYSDKSHPGCLPQKHACIPRCRGRANCVGGLGIDAYCECPPGLTGHHCDSPTVPVSLESESFAKVALSFTPDLFSISFQLRMRTRSRDATVLLLTSQESKTALVLKLENGVICFSLVDLKSSRRFPNSVSQNNSTLETKLGGKSKPSTLSTVGLEGISVNDGRWHTIKGGKYGDSLLLEVDNGDSGERNETLLEPLKEGALTPEFKIDVREGVTIGGIPHYANGALTHVEGDLSESCLDDLRIQGKQVPLPMALNETKWGQVTTFRRFKTKCIAPDSCEGKDCKPPLVCRDEWRRGTCRCPPGQQFATIGGCQEMDMCLFGPCLNGGSCVQDKSGMSCLCKPQFTGQNCEWEIGAKDLAYLLNPTTLVVSISALFFLASFVIICCIKFYLRKRRSRERKEELGEGERGKEEEGEDLNIFFIYEKEDGRGEKGIRKKTEETRIAGEGETLSKPGIAKIPEVLKVPGAPTPNMTGQDDLRAYAYEGGSSSSGSLTSALSGLRREIEEESTIAPLVPTLGDVIDLLKDLKDS